MGKTDRPLSPWAGMPSAIFLDKTLQGNDLRVFGVLSAHANTVNLAWPDTTRLVKLLGISKSNVFRSIKRLLLAGYVYVETRGGGRTRSNVYRIKKGVMGDTVKGPEKGVICDTERVSPVTPKQTSEHLPPLLLPPQGGKTDGPGGPNSVQVSPPLNPPRPGGKTDGPDGPKSSPCATRRPDQSKPRPVNNRKRLGKEARSKVCAKDIAGRSPAQQHADQKIAEHICHPAGWTLLGVAYDLDHDPKLRAEAIEKIWMTAEDLGLRWEVPTREEVSP